MNKYIQTARLENWSFEFIYCDDPYKAPEQSGSRARGCVFADRFNRFSEGRYIHTSSIVAQCNGYIRTSSCSVYKLGEPDEKFVAWLESREQTIEDYKDFGEPFEVEAEIVTILHFMK